MAERRTDRREDVELMLQLEKIATGKRQFYLGGISALRSKLSGHLRYVSESQRAAELLKRLESHHPDIANYLYTIENRLQAIGPSVAGAILDAKYKQIVNISSSGLRANSLVQVNPGDELLVRALHPSTQSIFVCLAQVVYTQPPGPEAPLSACKIALSFSDVAAEDSKAIRSIIASAMMANGQAA